MSGPVRPRCRRPSALRLPLALLSWGVTVALAPPTVAQTCPSSELQFNGAAPFTTSAATFDSTVSSTSSALGYDIPAGTLTLHSVGKFPTRVRVRDRFAVSGLAPGTPVPLTVRLVLDGTIGTTDGCGGSNCWGYLGALLAHGSDVDNPRRGENIFGGPPRAVHLEAHLSIVFVAGQPELLEFELNSIGSQDHYETGTGTFHFDGLPAGALVTSCQGFVDAPTPAWPASWGRVKATYR